MAALCTLSGIVLALVSHAAHADALEAWAPRDTSLTAAMPAIDHGLWQALLDRYLDTRHPSGINRFAYRAVTAADRASLDAYLEQLAGTDPRRYPASEAMAYWINLYNAATVRLILEHPDVGSIRDIRDGLFDDGPWDRRQVAVAGAMLSLNDIEHRILRPLFGDRRIHYALNCASLGCPNLAAHPYAGATLDAQLAAAERAYLNHPRGLELRGNTLWVSEIFLWYRSDFPAGDAALRAYWAGLLDDPGTAAAVRIGKGRIRYRYDWRLNASEGGGNL